MEEVKIKMDYGSFIKYFFWIQNMVLDPDKLYKHHDQYYKTCWILFQEPFAIQHPLDENRAIGGLALRERYMSETASDPANEAPCSLLEAMVALARRIDDEILYDPDYGCRAWEWFIQMQHSLFRLEDCYVLNVDTMAGKEHAEKCLSDFRVGGYEPNGIGGLFTISNPAIDMRRHDLWQQANIWLNESKRRMSNE